MRRFAILVLICATIFPSLALAKDIISVAHVYTPNYETWEYLSTFDVDFEESDRPFYSRIVTNHQNIDKLKAAGFEVEVYIDDLMSWVEARNRRLESMPPEPEPVEVVLDHYLTHAEVMTFLYDLETAYPAIMSVEVVGYSVLGRELFLVKISDNVDTNEAEPAIFFEHNIHGDEIACYIHGLYTIEWLVTNYGTDADITELVNTREIFVEPLTNPDGNQEDDGTYGRSRYNANGVDMNRNNGYMWEPSSTHGPSLHSEPETQALAHVWASPQPYSIGVSSHSGTIVVSLPWSYHWDAPLDWDEVNYLGEQYCYPNYCLDSNLDTWYQGSHGMYQMHGSTKDEMYGSHGMMAWTVELTYSKQCSWSTTAAVLTNHEPAVQFLIEEIGEGLHGTVTSADTDDPVAATIAVDGKWTTFSDYEVGDFHKYLRPGNYDVRIFANGYEDYNTNVDVVAGTPTVINAELTASASTNNFVFRWLFSRFPNDEDTHTLTIDALGPPDGEFVSIGTGGFAIMDLGPDGISNEAGDDIAVYESHTDGDETFTLFGSSDDYFGPWVQIGTGLGNSSFDLDDTSLTWVRYIKIQDNTDLDDPGSDAGQYDGYDLDAIGTPALFASFSADVTSGPKPLTVNFTDNSGGGPTSWDWDFGDGGSSTQQNPTHEYTDNGLYTVSLTIIGPLGTDTLIRDDYIEVIEPAPVAEFSGTPTSGTIPLEVTFTNESTGPITTYAWQFGDGDTSTEENPVHTYDAPGMKTVRLTVTGPGGSDVKTRWNYINATCPTPIADFEADVTVGQAPLDVNFTNLTDSPASCPCTYNWTFGDGGSSTVDNPVHTYDDPGVYNVLLTAANDGGSDNEQKDEYIEATDGPVDDDVTDDDVADDDVADDDVADDDQTDDDVADDDQADDDAGDDDDDDGCGC